MTKKITQVIHSNLKASPHQENSSALFLNSGYIFDSYDQGKNLFAEQVEGYVYSRYTHPNVDEFHQKVAILENAQNAQAFSSGMASISAIFFTFLEAGDSLLVSEHMFGSTHKVINKYLKKFDINVLYFNARTPQAELEQIIQKNSNIKLCFIETPSNPTMELFDIGFLKSLLSDQTLLVVDNTYATPIFQNPLDWGADLVTHSATKFMDGQGRVLGGIVAGNEKLIAELKLYVRIQGNCISPFNAWLLSQSLDLLELRVNKQADNARILSQRLIQHSKVENVLYPELENYEFNSIYKKQMSKGGSLISIYLKKEVNVEGFINSLKLITFTANLGDIKTLITHPAITTHSSLDEDYRNSIGITHQLMRLSIGIENVEDIWEDIQTAIEKN